MDTELGYRGVRGQADAIADGTVTSVALVQQSLDRIAAVDPRINAFSEVLAQPALAEAAVRDATPPGERGPLHGVPFGIKQELDVSGTVTTFGGRANTTPVEQDCELVRRLREAGAVIVGKTTMPEFGQWPFTESLTTGLTRNPWHSDHSTGGSSGGTAAAVASGMVAAGIGGDGGGSIRIPAACCGLFGLKPSRGRVSSSPHSHLWYSLGTAGPLTRTVEDSALIYDVISGALPTDMFQAPPLSSPLVEAAHTEPGRLRIGWTTRPATRGMRPKPSVVAATKNMAHVLSDLGHDVREIDPHYPDVSPAFVPLFFGGVRAEAFEVEHYDRLEPRTRQVVRMGSWVRPGVVDWAVRKCQSYAMSVNRIFDDIDVLLTPTLLDLPPHLPVLGRGGAPAAMLKSTAMIAYTALWNVTGNPAASVPAGFSTRGLPYAVQLVGRPFDEATLISLSAQIERAHPWAGRTPTL